MRLEGKVAIITGAGSGMGRAMANLFAAEGAKVIAAEWNQATLDEVVAEVKAAGGEITGVQGDVSKLEECRKIVETAASTYGTLDVLCNNAGVMDNFAGAAHYSDDVLARVMGINAYGPLYLTREALKIMLPKGSGSIVNTASVAGEHGGAAGAVYTMSKHAVVGLTRNTAWYYAKTGIRCNSIIAGGVETNIMSSVDPSTIDPEGGAQAGVYASIIPAMLKAQDIANLALFLASDESKMISGANIPADAGWTAS
ncbi:MAG: SDR family oxidoreductase [Coriobacteriia bacterium]|nr:SDR family oxidoreductase [Coriobacteriia bacterium]